MVEFLRRLFFVFLETSTFSKPSPDHQSVVSSGSERDLVGFSWNVFGNGAFVYILCLPFLFLRAGNLFPRHQPCTVERLGRKRDITQTSQTRSTGFWFVANVQITVDSGVFFILHFFLFWLLVFFAVRVREGLSAL